ARQREPAHDRAALGPSEVDRDHALVARERRPPEAAAVEELAPLPHRIAGLGALDLDDLGAEVTEQLAGEGTGDEAAELEHPHAVERAVVVSCHPPSTNGAILVKSTPGSAAAKRCHSSATAAPTVTGPPCAPTAST